MISSLRLRDVNGAPVRPDADFVLYWMIAFRRPRANFALQRAVELAREWKKPLVVLEALGCGHRWASARTHRFVLDGMRANRDWLARKPAFYHPYVEPRPGAGKGLVEALSIRACAVVTDEYPCFELPAFVAAAGRQSTVRVEAVDSNGLLPLRAAPKAFARAVDLRRFLQKELPRHLGDTPRDDPLARVELPLLGDLPRSILRRWPAAGEGLLAGEPALLAALPIDHEVPPVDREGGFRAAAAVAREFVAQRLGRYDEDQNHPDARGGSGLSPWLHFGHVSGHEVFARVAAHEGWRRERLGQKATGKREGWWGMSPAAEAFLDQLVTWRELGFVFCSVRDDHDRYESLPAWAQETLAEHASDPRPHLYSREEFESARTGDELWNAAQRQLRREGVIHNYLRMLWGKKILEWSPDPREALAVMIELNNRWALDGRDPNSYSGIFWVLGRFDRAWGPQRPIYGKVRYMTSDSARRKLRLRDYLERYA